MANSDDKTGSPQTEKLGALAVFEKDAEHLTDLMRRAIQKVDYVEVERAAHLLKSSAADLGLKDLADKFYAIEGSAHTLELEGCRTLLDGVQFELRADIILLRSHLEDGRPFLRS